MDYTLLLFFRDPPGSTLFPYTTLFRSRVTLGKRVLIHAGAVLGADGFGIARGRDGWVKVPQLGGVRVGDDCEIGANTDRKSTRLNSSHVEISYAVFCLKKKIHHFPLPQ